MYILFLVFGMLSTAFGLINLFSKRVDEWIQRHVGESKIDKKLFSPKGSYFVRRYVAGFNALILGLMMIALFFLFYFAPLLKYSILK